MSLKKNCDLEEALWGRGAEMKEGLVSYVRQQHTCEYFYNSVCINLHLKIGRCNSHNLRDLQGAGLLSLSLSWQNEITKKRSICISKTCGAMIISLLPPPPHHQQHPTFYSPLLSPCSLCFPKGTHTHIHCVCVRTYTAYNSNWVMRLS